MAVACLERPRVMMTENGSFNWFALQVRPQYEKRVSAALQSKGYEEFLPLSHSRRRWSDRVKEISEPLFPGYVFCRFSLHSRLPILLTPGVLFIVGAGKMPSAVDDREIESLQCVVRSELTAEPCPYVRVGQRVRIEQGALAGVEGLLAAIKNKHRLVVSVTLLQRSVAVEIEEEWVCPSVSPALTAVPALEHPSTTRSLRS